MNLTYLKTYIEVVKKESLLKASKNLFISQPAISFQIKKLEQELGIRLIDRDKNHFAINTAGRRFFRFAELVCSEHKTLLYDLDKIEKCASGNLIIMTSSIIGEYLLPPILSEFSSNNPGVDIKMRMTDSLEVIKTVQNDVNIVGFCGAMIGNQNLEYLKIGQDEIVLIVYPGHPFSTQNEVNLFDLNGESLISRYDPDKEPEHYVTQFVRCGLILGQYKPKLILASTTSIISAVESKLGIAFVSNLAAKKSENEGTIKVVKIKGFSFTRDLFCIFRKNAITASPYKDFIWFIKNHYQE